MGATLWSLTVRFTTSARFEQSLELEGIGFRFRWETLKSFCKHWLDGGPRRSRSSTGCLRWAFTICERSLLIARDHAGIKPLYYLKDPAGFLFASQYDAIMAHPWTRNREPVGEHLSLYHHLGYLPAPYALLRDTHALEPGTWLRVDLDRSITRGRHFELPLFREPELHGEAACEAIDSAVAAAVKRHLVSDVPVGVFLSGGIDSPLVAAKMVEAMGAGFPAFTLSTLGDQHDEAEEATAYAKEFGVEHHICPITSSIAMTMLDDVVAACGEPMDDYLSSLQCWSRGTRGNG